jgi:imidazolonepropionase-like amidohydrolase
MLGLGAVLWSGLQAQADRPVNGTPEREWAARIWHHVTLHVAPDEVIEDATLVVEEGRVVAAGPFGTVSWAGPAVVRDLPGFHVYPSLIDLNAEWGLREDADRFPSGRGPQDLSDKPGAYHWNESIHPESRAVDAFEAEGEAKPWIEAGIGAVLTHRKDGIARGSGTLVTFDTPPHNAIIREEASRHFSFRKGSSSQDYPRSLMGATALLEQTAEDAAWYAAGGDGSINLSLEAWNGQRALPAMIEVSNWQDALRADALRKRMGEEAPWAFVGLEDGYRQTDELHATGALCVLPLNFPQPFDVSDPITARYITLEELKHWEWAPAQAAQLVGAGVPVAFTSAGLKSPKELVGATRQAMQHGLSEAEALAAWTTVPAGVLGVQNELGTLKPGSRAHLLLTDGPLFAEGTNWFEHWIAGTCHVLQPVPPADIRGWYDVTINGQVVRLEVEGTLSAPKAQWRLIEAVDTTRIPVSIEVHRRQVMLQSPADPLGLDGVLRFTGNVWMDSRIWEGTGELPSGEPFVWSAIRQSDEEEEPTRARADSTEMAPPILGPLTYPFMAYGRPARPAPRTVLFQGATVWTNELEGTLASADVLIHAGQILAVGVDLDPAAHFGKQPVPADLEIINARGMHLTCGIIDEHSHIAATRGINEGTQSSSAEVSLQHVINSEDIDIYRQLAGGVTTSQILHGSANPIGGQSALIKLRWGATPEEMLYADAPPFIKFALGENVKQSNWGPEYTTRFPQTRMGVEQVFYERFLAAAEYAEAWRVHEREVSDWSRKVFRRGEPPVPPRRDLELEVLAQILHGERHITCHSYRQDEINMLMHMADSLGFRINTFTHILEGYKLADKLAEHGAAGSTFSDWWAYKYEVKDAIPYNGAVLHGQGVLTGFNSDDAEMARRLNQEAAKAIKYGGVPEEEAWKFVTLNPARMLHIDDRVGSIAPGKDADLVLWDGHPMSIYTRAVQTWVDGRCEYDAAEDAQMREAIRMERARLIQAMLADPSDDRRQPERSAPFHYHCDTDLEETR